MSADDNRYAMVNSLWQSLGTLPPFTREEATKAAASIARNFGPKRFGQPWQTTNYRIKAVRRCWISSQPVARGDISKGLARICHDLSHDIHDVRVGPSLRRQHSFSHAALELQIAQFAVAQRFHTGRLKPTPPSVEEQRAAKLALIEAGLKRWETKRKRAQNALWKLQRQRDRLTKATA